MLQFSQHSAARQLLDLLRSRGETVATCESLTAGLAAATLAEIPGASAVLRGGLITYATAVKAHFTHIPQHKLEEAGVVSGPTAIAMARAAAVETGADWALSFTGVAGPDKQEGKPAGTVFIGIFSTTFDVSFAFKARDIEGDRNAIRAGAVAQGFAALVDYIQENQPRREQPDIVMRWTK